MYDFIDTNEVSEGAVLPSEALQINGVYIEDLIPGYRTLNVSGREALAPELNAFETGVRDGSKLKSRRFPARTLVVTYQLIADGNEAFRSAYNELGRILNVQDAELIFNDEQDKFFIGTPSAIGEVEPGRNAVVGSFEITCTDPFKYSVIEYEATADLDEKSVLIDYNGTHKAYPTLQANFYKETEVGADGETAATLTGDGDCGYIAFFDENEKIIQLGDPDEADTSGGLAKSQTLVNQEFKTSTAWGTAAKKPWAANSASGIPVDVTQAGSVAMAAAPKKVASSDASSSGTLLTIASKSGSPVVNYTVKAKATNRTASSVKVTVTVTASLQYASSYMGNGLMLDAYIYIGGKWHKKRLKEADDYWRGKSGHTVNLTVTVSGLSASSTALSGIKFRADRADDYGESGVIPETACKNLSIVPYGTSDIASHYLTASSYGSGSGWHGTSITRNIGADAAGVVGATDFTFTYQQRMCIANTSSAQNQRGGFHSYLMTADNKVLAGVRIIKSTAGKVASLMLFVNGVKVHQVGIDMHYTNKFFGIDASGTSTIQKSGNKVTFNVGGYVKAFTDSSIASIKATKIIFMFDQYASVAALSSNGLFWAKFVKNNCSTVKDIPNKFSANDVVEADCKDGQVLLNGAPAPQLGALGNDWEDFFLTPGLNQIGFSYSDWVKAGYEPTVKVRYREVFL